MFIIVQNPWENQQQINTMNTPEARGARGCSRNFVSYNCTQPALKRSVLPGRNRIPNFVARIRIQLKAQSTVHLQKHLLQQGLLGVLYPGQLILFFQKSKHMCAALGVPKEEKRRKMIQNAYPQVRGLFLRTANS